MRQQEGIPEESRKIINSRQLERLMEAITKIMPYGKEPNSFPTGT